MYQSKVLRGMRGAALLALATASVMALGAQVPTSNLHEGFLNPPVDTRPVMRWWWFGSSVTKPELKRELETMRGAGIGGVEIQPVYPLELDNAAKGIRNLPYLSPEFLDDVSFANTTARSLGMRVDITLGSGWPYGGPHTSLELAAGRLKVASATIAAGKLALPELAEGDKLIAAFAVKGNAKSFDAASATRLDLDTKAVPASLVGETALFFLASHTRQMVKRPAASAEGYVLDHFARAAINEHIADVATPLLKAFGDQPPYSVFSDSLEVYGADWTPNLPAEFLKRRDYDLVPHLPELVAGGTLKAEAIRHDWGLTLSELIRENYLVPLTQFAEEHHTRFRSQTYGEPAVTFADEAAPNLPEGEGPQWRAFSFTRWASSASHLYDRNVTSAETWTWLHSPAFRATPLDMKVEADRMFLLGVNQLIGHGYPYSPPSAGEPGWAFYAAAALNDHNPWFAVMPDVTKYLQRVSWLLRQGKPANDVALLLPEDDAQAAYMPGHVSVTVEMRRLITPELMSVILDAGYNIDYIDASTIDKLSKIPYPVLVIPPTDRIPLATYRKIERFAAAGGKVITVGKLPSLAPGLKEQNESAEIASLSKKLLEDDASKAVHVASVDGLREALHNALAPDLDATGQAAGLGFLHRKLAQSDIYFVVNTENHPMDTSVHFRAARTSLEAWDPDGGRVLEKQELHADSRIKLTLAPYESRIFVLKDHLDPSSQQKRMDAAVQDKQVAELSGGWQLRFPGDKPQMLSSLTSWTNLPEKKYYSGEGVYSRSITLHRTPNSHSHWLLDFGAGTPTVDPRPPGSNGIRALLDPPIREAAVVFVNGRRVGSLWHPPYRIDISEFVHSGENAVEVHVYNTAINLLSGQPPHDYTALRAMYGRRFDPQDMDNLQPVPSGLFGTIRLLEETGR